MLNNDPPAKSDHCELLIDPTAVDKAATVLETAVKLFVILVNEVATVVDNEFTVEETLVKLVTFAGV